MWLPTQWIPGSRKRKRAIVTVCWTDGRVSLVRWGGATGCPVVERTAVLEPADCTPANYQAVLKSLLGARGNRAWVEWIILTECFPTMGREGIGSGTREPVRRAADWMEACWKGLSRAAIPDRILSAMECLEEGLKNWAEFNQAGTGICLPLDGHELFIGYGDAGHFRRLSRRATELAKEQPGPEAEWLQQTRMLYRGRTGQELRRVLIPGRSGCESGSNPDAAVERVTGRYPPAWIHQPGVDLPGGILFLHACGWRRRSKVVAGLKFSVLEALVSRSRRVHALRLGTLLLAGGWVLLLLGACESNPEKPGPLTGAERWQRESHRWEGMDREWRAKAEKRAARERPYRLVGAIGESIPEGVRLERIRIEETDKGAGSELSLLLEGVFSGEHASPVFRGWMEALKADSPLSDVESLRFEQKPEGIAFHLVARTGSGEVGQ